MRYRIYIIFLAIAAFAATQLRGAAQDPQTPQQHGMANMSMMQNCPVQVPGAEVSISDTNDGIALAITTQSGDVADLRRRAENMAKMHSGDGMHGNMMPFSVVYEEIPNGGRLTLKPKDPGKLEEFRSIVRQHAEQMQKHDCSMMQGMMNGMPGAQTPKSEPKSDESDHSAHHPGGQK